MATARRVLGRSTRRFASKFGAGRAHDRPLWLLGGSSGREYCDNSRAIHEYLLANRADVEAVWAIDGASADVREVSRVGPWIDLRSTAAHRLVRSADVLVFSHGIHDLPGLLSTARGTVVRLGHGLTAFKQTKGRTPRSLQRMTSRVDLAPVASAFEREHKRTWGFEVDRLPITGLARWDVMRRAQADAGPATTVLFALTWRDWIDSSSLASSDYWAQICELADRAWFDDVLTTAGLEAELFLHPLIRDSIASRVAQLERRPRLVNRGAEVPESLGRAALVITDYSSLAWDALYLGIPVMFFHFDLEHYLQQRASFVDLRSRLFGPAVRSVPELELALREFIGRNCELDDWSADRDRWRSRAFAYDDVGNCERIVHAIERRACVGR